MNETELTAIMQMLGRIEQKVDNALCVQRDHEKRLRLLEGRGAKRWDAIALTCISAAISALCGYVLGPIR